jgi:thiol-disulfide isomerase/thioredoxin
LALVFVAAAVGKLLDLSGSARAMVDFGVPERVARLAGPVLPVAELAAAALLLPAATSRYGAVLAAALLVAFSVGIARALARGRAPDCHCFGQLHSEPAGPEAVARNVVLAAMAVTVAAVPSPEALPGAFEHLSDVQVALVVATVLAIALALWSFSLSAARRTAAKDLESALQAMRRPGLPRASQAPEFELVPVAGEARTLGDLRAGGRPVILVFLGTDCGPCLQLLPELGRWQEVLAGSVSLTAIFSGDRDAVERLTREHGLRSVLAQPANETFELYALRGTPSGVAVDPAGMIANSAAEGAAAIEALVRTALAGRPPAALKVENVAPA